MRHAERRAVLACPPHFDHRAVHLAHEHFFDEAAGEEAPREKPLEHTIGRQQQGPRGRRGHHFIVRVGPGAVRQLQFGCHPGAVIHQAFEIHVLGEGHKHAAVHAGGRAVHRVIAPGLGAFEIHDDLPGGGDLHLNGNVVEPVRMGRAAGNRAFLPSHGHRTYGRGRCREP